MLTPNNIQSLSSQLAMLRTSLALHSPRRRRKLKNKLKKNGLLLGGFDHD